MEQKQKNHSASGNGLNSRRTIILIAQSHILRAFPTRSSFGTAYRERLNGLSHIEQTLNPGVLGQPVRGTSLEASGQWPLCFAGASPTEDPLFFLLLKRLLKFVKKKTKNFFRKFLVDDVDSLALYASCKKLRSNNQINSRSCSVCYWLKCCIGTRFSKTRSTGRKR